MMPLENWKKVKEIFDVAVELPTAGRADFLRDECAGDDELRGAVERMLRADDSDNSILDAPIVDLKSVWSNDLPEISDGAKIGEYKIVREIGRGGMGVVYLASRDDGEFEQRVALKIIKRGMDTDEITRRFRHERQILATLEHPNIARLLGGGVSGDGLPFYAMELIEGVPIDEFCASENPTVGERLELFRQICGAVSYAHSRLVVHRDLKPSNILVTKDGAVKLLDFGIAKVLAPEADQGKGTATRFGMMTPAYASPEQKRGETVTTATDVYSLGVILAEILAAEPGVKTNRQVAETNPKSEIQNLKSKDLQAILQTALRDEQTRRYSSVEQFAEDVRRHLNGLPILARPDTLGYRASKFIGRNRLAVLSAALIVLALLGGISAAVWQARRAERERLLAQKRFEISRRVANALVFKYHDAISNLPDSSAAREMLLADASVYLDELAADAGDDRALQRELGQAYLKLSDIQGSPNSASTGNTAAAAANCEKAVGFFEALHRRAAPAETEFVRASNDLLDAYNDAATIYWRTNELERRRIYLDKRKTLVEDVARRFPDNQKYKMELLRVRHAEGNRLLRSDFAAGVRFYEENILPPLLAAEATTAERGLTEANGIRVYNTLGLAYNDYGSMQREIGASRAEAEVYFRKSLEYYTRAAQIYERQFAPDQTKQSAKRNYAVGVTTVGIALRELERFDEAFDFLNRGHRLWEELAAFDRNDKQAVFDLGDSNSSIGLFYLKRKDYRKAVESFEKSIGFFDRVIAADAKHHEAISYKIDVLCFLAAAHSEAGQSAAALETFAAAKTFSQNLTGEANDRVQIGRIHLQTGRALLKSGDREKARREFEQALEIIEKSGAEDAALQRQAIDFQMRQLSGQN